MKSKGHIANGYRSSLNFEFTELEQYLDLIKSISKEIHKHTGVNTAVVMGTSLGEDSFYKDMFLNPTPEQINHEIKSYFLPVMFKKDDINTKD